LPKVIFNGYTYNYASQIPDIQTKQAILFIHGAGGSHRRWAFQVKKLGHKYFTLAVDLPGHGESSGATSNKIEEYGNFISDFIDHVLGVKCYLAGHSMGGAIALDVALRFSEKLQGIILIGTGARLRVAPAILETFASGKVPPHMVDFAYGSTASKELLDMAREEMNNTDPSINYHDFTACNNFDVTQQLQSINLPALIIGGSEDKLTPLKYSEFLAANLTNSQITIIENAGHMMMLENPVAVSNIIDQFISERS